MILEDLLKLVFSKGGSDLHISVGLSPIIRVHGKLIRVDCAPLAKDDVQKIIMSILTNEQRRNLEQNWELDCSYGTMALDVLGLMFIKKKAIML